MVQPRKEQVKNTKTKYTRFSQVGTLVLTGGPVQDIVNTGSENFYDNLLSSTVTGSVRGAESSSSAFIYGGFGPFAIPSNPSMNILISGFNDDLPILVTFTSVDLVSIGGASVLTTARAANRINTTLAAAGVTASMASSVNGQLVIRSANDTGFTYGSDASITLTDVTPGLLNVLGLATLNSVNAVGTTAPAPGLITVSQDGLGGFVQLKSPSLSRVDPSGSNALLFGDRKFIPEYLPGRPCFARVQSFPGADLNGKKIRLTYQRIASRRPSIVTGQSVLSNFTSLEGGDQVTVTVTSGIPFNLSVTFTVTFTVVTTVQQVVDAINAAWNTQTVSQFGISSTRASVALGYSGPYRFTNSATRDSFFVRFNGNTAIHVNPGSSLTATAFASYINTQISSASQTAEGEAVVITFPDGNPGVVIQSKNTNATFSSVEFLPGNPGFVVPGTFMETLDMLGLVPGIYKGTNVARLYGNDEIEFIGPSALSGASITVTFPVPAVAAKLGLDTTQTISSSVGIQNVAIPESQALLPESMEFSQEPDNYDTYTQDYLQQGRPDPLDPTVGIRNSRNSSLLGPDGKLIQSLIPRILGPMSVDTLRLGTNLLSSATDQLSPRLRTHQESTKGPVLFWEGTSATSGAAAVPTRIYINNGTLLITHNALWVGGATPWSRSLAGVNSSLAEIRNGQIVTSYYASGSSTPWADTSWNRNIKLNSTGIAGVDFGTEILNLGQSLQSSVDSLKPRVKNPVGTDIQTLISETVATGGVAIRVYSRSGISESSPQFLVTSNARWDGSNFNKDVSGLSAVALAVNGRAASQDKTGLFFYYKQPSSNSPWNRDGWTNVPLQIDTAASTFTTTYAINLNSDLNLTGDLNMVGDIDLTGSFDATGDIDIQGDIFAGEITAELDMFCDLELTVADDIRAGGDFRYTSVKTFNINVFGAAVIGVDNSLPPAPGWRVAAGVYAARIVGQKIFFMLTPILAPNTIVNTITIDYYQDTAALLEFEFVRSDAGSTVLSVLNGGTSTGNKQIVLNNITTIGVLPFTLSTPTYWVAVTSGAVSDLVRRVTANVSVSKITPR